MSSSNQPKTYLTIPENILRRKIGKRVTLSEIFTPDKLNHCQQMLDEAHAGFALEMDVQLQAIGGEYMKAMESPAAREAAIEKIAELAFALKKRMESLNYVFGHDVAESLYRFIHETPDCDSNALLVVCKHLAVLNIILKDKIKGDGGVVGREMLANLKSLIQKTHHQT